MRIVSLFGVSFVFVLACSSLSAQEDKKSAGAVEHVVLVSVDGLAASYLSDPRAEMPTLRKLAAEGASARGMITSFPSVTWPSHVTLITGVHPAKHGVIGNAVWNRKTGRGLTYVGDPELQKSEAIRVPTLYDAAHAAGLSCGSIIWPASSGAETLKWVIPDSGREDLHARFTTPGFVEELGKAGIDISKLGVWGWNKQYSTERDLLYTRVANYLLEKHQANLVLVHLITPDGVEHGYGPHTPEAYASVKESDDRIAEIWATLQKPPLAGKSTLFVVSDHGFAPYEKMVRPNVLFKELGLIQTEAEDKVTKRDVWCVSQGGSAFIYVLDNARKNELLKLAKDKLKELEGVEAIVEPSSFAKLGIPQPADNAQAPDLVLLTGPGYSFADVLTPPVVAATIGLKGNHGHDPKPDYMHATFVAWGAGIKPGTKLDIINNVDVAPTIARLMNVAMKDMDGRVLTEILSSDRPR